MSARETGINLLIALAAKETGTLVRFVPRVMLDGRLEQMASVQRQYALRSALEAVHALLPTLALAILTTTLTYQEIVLALTIMILNQIVLPVWETGTKQINVCLANLDG